MQISCVIVGRIVWTPERGSLHISSVKVSEVGQQNELVVSLDKDIGGGSESRHGFELYSSRFSIIFLVQCVFVWSLIST